ncbi:cell wall hydrolase [Thermohalobacter berrensis]|uniref:Cell wall hydrolase n=1 Tax=Thermohalobacter berrensis TaxID=99594 RepID=A0A419T4H5_9FIRM|nr:cell wall hydrolase [Thermohalobacter berrensis]
MKKSKSLIITFLIMVFIIIISVPTNAYASGFFYTVKKGDSLWEISQEYGITVYRIKKENNYWSDIIYPGQKLYISGKKKFSKYEKYLVAKAVHAEARGEPFKGQVAVASVILNRVESNKFPNTVYGVIYQPYAFTAVIDGQIKLEPNREAYRATELAIKGWDPSKGALFYFNPKIATSKWIWSRPQITKIGDHIFAK